MALNARGLAGAGHRDRAPSIVVHDTTSGQRLDPSGQQCRPALPTCNARRRPTRPRRTRPPTMLLPAENAHLAAMNGPPGPADVPASSSHNTPSAERLDDPMDKILWKAMPQQPRPVCKTTPNTAPGNRQHTTRGGNTSRVARTPHQRRQPGALQTNQTSSRTANKAGPKERQPPCTSGIPRPPLHAPYLSNPTHLDSRQSNPPHPPYRDATTPIAAPHLPALWRKIGRPCPRHPPDKACNLVILKTTGCWSLYCQFSPVGGSVRFLGTRRYRYSMDLILDPCTWFVPHNVL